MSYLSGNNLVVIIGVVSNILSVVGVVICNKYIIEVDHFNYSVFLSFLHFAFTALGTRVMLFSGYFSQNTAPLSGILPVAVGSLLSVAFMNMNLAYNSVGFYQVSSHRLLLTSTPNSFCYVWWDSCQSWLAYLSHCWCNMWLTIKELAGQFN